MSKIISIGTAVPAFQHEQNRILTFMQEVYRLDAVEARKLKFLYRQSGIDYRYSAISDFSKEAAAVSYTHLDVYKRQGLSTTKTKG